MTTSQKTLKLINTKELSDGEGYVFNTYDGYPVFTADKKLDDLVEGKNKWKIGVSLSSGCSVGCIYCFTNRFDHHRLLTGDEIKEQVEYVVDLPYNSVLQYDEVKVEMKQMGDPLVNPDNTLDAISKIYEEHPTFTQVVSTSGPKDYRCFFDRLKDQRRKGTNIRLQFSCHTTNDEEKKILSPRLEMMKLEEIAETVDNWYDGRNKVTLNFVPMKGYELDGKKLTKMFDKDQVFVKISYVDVNRYTKGRNIEDATKEIFDFAKRLKKKGFSYAYRN